MLRHTKTIISVIIFILFSLPAFAWPDAESFGELCDSYKRERGWTFFFGQSNERLYHSSDLKIELEDDQNILFISDIGLYYDSVDWQLRVSFMDLIKSETGINAGAGSVWCYKNKKSAEAARAAVIQFYRSQGISHSYENGPKISPRIYEVRGLHWPQSQIKPR